MFDLFSCSLFAHFPNVFFLIFSLRVAFFLLFLGHFRFRLFMSYSKGAKESGNFRDGLKRFREGINFIFHTNISIRVFFFFCSFTNVVASISFIFVLNRNRIYCRREHFLCVSILPRH